MARKDINNYCVRMKGKDKVIPANMLKQYFERLPIEAACGLLGQDELHSPLDVISVSLIDDNSEDGHGDLIDLFPSVDGETYKDVVINPALSSQQKQQVLDLLEEF